MEIKDLIIFLLIFIVVLWLQHNDDKKFNKPPRKSLYDIIKLPLVVSLIILIVRDLNCKISENFEAIFIMPDNMNFDNIFNGNTPSLPNLSNDRFNDIFLGPPDF